MSEPTSTKGRRGNATDDVTHADQVDHRGKGTIGSGYFTSKPTMVDEESANSSPTEGFNDYTRPDGDQTKSDRFKK